jgi:hypothetical protein
MQPSDGEPFPFIHWSKEREFFESVQANIGAPPKAAIPEGWILVPISASDAMANAAFKAAGCPADWFGFDEMWKAALAEAPKPEGKQ